MMYSRGPRTEPCGRPYGAGTHRDLVEPWTTLKVRSWRKEPIHPRKLPDSPNVTFNRFRRYEYIHLIHKYNYIYLFEWCTTFLYQGAQRIIFSALEDQRQNYDLN